MTFYYGLFLGLSFGAIIGYVLGACFNVGTRKTHKDVNFKEYAEKCQREADRDHISVFPCI